MKTVTYLKQNSPEWHQWRSQGLGASEANIIMGVSKFMSPNQLWNEKVNGKKEEDKGGNFITEKGHRLESKARPLFEMERGYDFPDMIAQHSVSPFLRASLDGYCEELNEVWECKFVGQEDFEKVKNGEVLEQYYPQLQHQLMVTGAYLNNLYVITDDKDKKGEKFPYKTACLQVPVNETYISEVLVPSLFAFWDHVETKTPPALSKLDSVDMGGNKELVSMLGELEFLNGQIAKAEDLKKKIFSLCKHNKVICGGVKIIKSKSEDSVKPDYEKYCVENEVDMSSFMKNVKGRTTKRITFPKRV